MDTNPGSVPTGQPPQGGSFGAPSPQGQQPMPGAPQPQSSLAVKPAWQVEAMQQVWAQQGTKFQQQQATQQIQQQPMQGYGPQPMQSGIPQVQQPGMGAPQVQVPLTTVPPQPPYQPPMSTTPMDGSYDAPKRSKSWVFILFFLLLLAIGGGALIYMMVVQGNKNNPAQQTGLSQALVTTLKTQTYNETLVTESNGQKVTRNRIADFRKVGEPHVYIDNIAPAGDKNTIQLTVIGGDYYARKHFTKEVVDAAKEGTKAQMAKINDQWVQVIDDGKPVADVNITDLIDPAMLLRQRLIVPSPLVVGYFRENDQQQFASFMEQNHIYSAPNAAPADEQIDGQNVQHYKVAVNADKVREFNTKVATTLGIKDTQDIASALKDTVSEQMDMWVRKSDQRVLKYSYQKGNTTYTYTYDKLDQAQEVSAPHVVGEIPEGANASDEDIQEAVNTVLTGLSEYQDKGNNIPNSTQSFTEFLTQRIDSGLRTRFILQFKNATPEKGYIFYQNNTSCNDNQDGFKPSVTSPSFALLTKLSDSLYCVDNTD